MEITPLVGEVTVPGDKSVTHRALLLGCVADGETVLRGALRADDTESTASMVTALGARVDWGDDVTVTGVADVASPEAPLDAGNAGTAARLMLGLLAGRPGRWVLDGDASLRSRPMSRVTGPLVRAGAHITAEGGGAPEGLPLAVRGVSLGTTSHEVTLPSAQVKSALLLSGLVADGPTTVVQHVPTRDHTETLLSRFGVRVDREPGTTTVHPGRPVATTLDVPGDPSAAAFLAVAAALTPHSEVWVRGVGLWPRRTGFLAALERAGADVMVLARPEAVGLDAEATDPVGDVRIGTSGLRAFDITAEDVPDLIDELPVLAIAAARASGTSFFTGLGELRHKESDRIASIAALLEALGVPVGVDDDGLTITGVPRFRRPGPLVDLSDHRLALAALVAARSAGFALPTPPSITVSWPGFDEVLARLG